MLENTESRSGNIWESKVILSIGRWTKGRLKMKKTGCGKRGRSDHKGNLDLRIARRRGGQRRRMGFRSIQADCVRSGPLKLSKVEQGKSASPLVATVDPNTCIGCGACQQVCPVQAISVNDVAKVDPDRCLGCGSCVDECPQEALSLAPAGRINEKAGGNLA